MSKDRDKQPAAGKVDHSPAPWSLGECHEFCQKVTDKFDGSVCSCNHDFVSMSLLDGTMEANANLIISSPWVYALFWALRNGWNLTQKWFTDDLGKVTGKGYEIITDKNEYIPWKSQWDDTTPDFDQRVYDAIKAAMREQEQH